MLHKCRTYTALTSSTVRPQAVRGAQVSLPDPGDGDVHQPAGDAGPRWTHLPPAQPGDHRQHHEAVPHGGAGPVGVQVGPSPAAAY